MAGRGRNLPQRPSQQASRSQRVQQTVTEVIQSPLPPPDMLMQYERAYPGATQLFVDWVSEEIAHRRAMEVRDQTYRHELEMDIVAGIFGALDLASLAGIFIYRTAKITVNSDSRSNDT